jgi:hypothetical protein
VDFGVDLACKSGDVESSLEKILMKKLSAMLILGILSAGWAVQASAQSHTRGISQSHDVRKAQKKQAKAQKKYAKAQRKAQRKMLKTERKNTKYPPRSF